MQRLKLFDMPFGNASSKYAETHLAVMNKDYKKLENLLQKGANPDQVDQDEGWTPLMWAVAYRRLDFIKLLLKYDANPNVQSDYGTTPISHCMTVAPSDYQLEHQWGSPKPALERHKALICEENNLTKEIISELLNHGANPFKINKSGDDAFARCHNKYYKELLTELTQLIKPSFFAKNQALR